MGFSKTTHLHMPIKYHHLSSALSCLVLIVYSLEVNFAENNLNKLLHSTMEEVRDLDFHKIKKIVNQTIKI